MTLPAIASVRASYPGAHLAILAKPPITDIYRLFSAADEIIPYEKSLIHRGISSCVCACQKSLTLQFFTNAIEAAIIVCAAGLRAGFASTAAASADARDTEDRGHFQHTPD